MKLKKLAVIIGLAGSNLAIATSAAQAFQVNYLGRIQGPKFSNFTYELVLAPNESFARRTQLKFDNFFGILGIASSPDNIFAATPGVDIDDEDGTEAIFTARRRSSGQVNQTQVFGGLTVLAALNATEQTGQACLGSNCVQNIIGPGAQNLTGPGAAVPEAESALVPFVALGFGYLYRRRRQQKNIQEILASQGQELS